MRRAFLKLTAQMQAPPSPSSIRRRKPGIYFTGALFADILLRLAAHEKRKAAERHQAEIINLAPILSTGQEKQPAHGADQQTGYHSC
jgi:hypothetical protein